MKQPHYETFREMGSMGIYLSFHTVSGGYCPLHWHEEVEILYPLNGNADIHVEGKTYRLKRKHLMVVESGKIHSTNYYGDTSMFASIHLLKSRLLAYMPEIEMYEIQCMPDEIGDGQFEEYLKLCQTAGDLIRLSMKEPLAFQMEADGMILQIFARLIRSFSVRKLSDGADTDQITMERVRRVITYVNENYQTGITLKDGAELLGIGKEYFCRFFKKNMGMSFLEYLYEVRCSHIYEELMTTEDSIAELMEKNGFSNQKLFNQVFRKIYGCTPSSVRRKKK